MHRIYENNDLMMYFKKRYCHCCGDTLKIKKTKKIVKTYDPEHDLYCSIGTRYTPHGDILVIGKEYNCKKCNKNYSCEFQSKVMMAQKKFKKKIVSEEEINIVDQTEILKNKFKLKLSQIFLVIPLFGGMICIYNILKNNSTDKEKSSACKLVLSSIVLLAIAIFFTSRIIYYLISNDLLPDFLNNYKENLDLILSGYILNLYICYYINFKI